MKKNSKNFHLNIEQKTYQILQRQANLNNQSMTKYIESLIVKKEKFNPQIIKAINQLLNTMNQYNTNYNALKSATSNLNQLMYFLNIGEKPTNDEIINAIDTTMKYVKENIENTKIIIDTLKPFTKIKTKKNLQSTKSEGKQ